ncbi:MAG: MFS transporter [Geodermatophilaceae bacterium]|nr:MFS transporter [Geodermatophilaceae bacterium]
MGQGAIAPVIALSALDLGASVGVASLVVGAMGVGQLLADVPAGSLTMRVGERGAMLLATLLLCGALLVCVFAPSVWLLGIAIGLTGAAGSVWQLARQAYLTEAVATHMRARALSTLGGVQRIGTFLGPFVGAAAMQLGGTDGAYWTHIAAAGCAATLLLVLPDVTKDASAGRAPVKTGIATVIRRHGPVLRTLGIGVMLVGLVRASRLAVIPLWAASIGLSSTTTALIFGLSSAVDMLLFYPAGKVMDRFGRVWVAVPCMLLMGLGLVAVPFTTGALTLALASALMGLGNGMGSGLVMVLGADASPSVGRAGFLGVWRLFSDAGSSGGPILLGAVAGVAGLAAGVWVVGAAGLAGAAAMWRWVPRLPRDGRVPRRSPVPETRADGGLGAQDRQAPSAGWFRRGRWRRAGPSSVGWAERRRFGSRRRVAPDRSGLARSSETAAVYPGP